MFTRRRIPVVARQGPAGVAAEVAAGVLEEGAEEMAAEVVAEEAAVAGDAETEDTGTDEVRMMTTFKLFLGVS